MQIDRIAAETDRCVKCGLCIPVCPTYRQSGDEAESPRGRVALVQALAAGNLHDRKALRNHLDRCLGCQACESACPSGVAVVAIVDAARALHRGKMAPPLRWPRRLWLDLLSKPRLLTPVFRLTGAWREIPAAQWLTERAAGLLGRRAARLYRLLPEASTGRAKCPQTGPIGHPLGRVTLFTGCVAQATEPQVTETAIRLLTRLGYEVSVPDNQVCCGAMHQHNGEPEHATKLAVRNLHALTAPENTKIVSTASGCAGHLRSYPLLSGLSDTAGAEQFASRITDISQFLCNAPWPARARLAPLYARVAVHDPCSLRNALGQAAAPYRLLSRIPGLSVRPLPGNEFCCGAAGTYMLQQPELSDALLAEKLAALRKDPPDLLLTSNPGCSLQLGKGVRELGLETRVLHPLQLIEKQLVIEA